MPTEDLEANFSAYIQDTLSKKIPQKEPDAFILQCHAFTSYTFEKLRINWRESVGESMPPSKRSV